MESEDAASVVVETRWDKFRCLELAIEVAKNQGQWVTPDDLVRHAKVFEAYTNSNA